MASMARACNMLSLHRKKAHDGATPYSFSPHSAWSEGQFGVLAGIPALNGELKETDLHHHPISFSFNTAAELWA